MADYCHNVGLVVTDLRESIHSACRPPPQWSPGRLETEKRVIRFYWKGQEPDVAFSPFPSWESWPIAENIPSWCRQEQAAESTHTYTHMHTHTHSVSFPHIFLIITARSPEAPSSSLHLVIQADKSFFFFSSSDEAAKKSEEHWKFCLHHPAQ